MLRGKSSCQLYKYNLKKKHFSENFPKMPLPPKESGKLIASLSTNVKINENNIGKLGDIIVDEIESGRLSTNNFSQTEVHPNRNDPQAIDWLFVTDTLNFCFWHIENEPGWIVDGYTGYFALCAAINRARKENINILNPKFYGRISEKELAEILRSDNNVPVPLLKERLQNLHEVGSVLLDKFDGTFVNCVKQANHSAVQLLQIIINNFKCYRDEAVYKGHNVGIYKRAQILIGDIWACFQNESIGYFKDIEEITMFADYRIPQSLLYFNIFEYSEELMKKLQNNDILKNGDEDEVEIRGCSIHAVELVREYVAKKLKDEKKINSILIDHFLWDFRRKHNEEIMKRKLPFHKTFCIYY